MQEGQMMQLDYIMGTSGVSAPVNSQAVEGLQMTSPSEVLYRLIPLTQGQSAIVDADKYEWLMQWKWCAVWSKDTQSFYAVRNLSRRKENARGLVYMHRAILGLEHGNPLEGDHDNHDTLDNRISNLVAVTGSGNQHNRGKQRNNKSGFKGVCRRSTGGKWIAQISIHRRRIYLGSFETAEIAYEAYCEAANEYHQGEK